MEKARGRPSSRRRAAGRVAMANVAVAALVLSAPALAAEDPQGGDAQEDLRKIVERQSQQLDEQRRALDSQRKRLDLLENALRIGAHAPTVPANFPSVDKRTRSGSLIPLWRTQQTQDGGQGGTSITGPTEPRDEVQRRSEAIASIEQGGVLTQKGSLVVEPSVQFSQSSVNRFFFSGLEVVETVLVGQIEATDSDRDSVIGRLTGRYGITNRSELEIVVPYVYRDDRITRQIVSANNQTISRSVDGHGIGDIEASARYQINSGNDSWPIFIASTRYKSTTGRGPFDVSRDALGLETELATGSGFHGIEPGITALFASDPAVFFASASYLFHLGRDVDTTIGGNQIGRVDPGDVVNVAFGMGFGINENTSFSLGYKHAFVQRTTTQINGADVSSETLDVGAALLGFGYRINDAVSVNLGLEIGATQDAPDIVATFRVPIRFNLFR